MQPINLDTFSLSLLTAKEDILNGRASTDWALFAYDGFTNNLKLFDSGAGGLTELTQKFHTSKPMYGLCRIAVPEGGQPRIVLICWVGEDVGEFRRTECSSHVPAVKNFFKEAHAFVNASNKEELTEEKIAAILAQVRPPMERYRRSSRPTEKEETVGTNYRKTNAAMEMRRINRDSFWARAEREEEQRKEEEKRKAAEERRHRERERVQQERKEEEERDRRMNEKLQMIEEQRRLDAKRREEVRKQEKAQWEVQQKQHEEEMRARFRRSESIEKAAEAAALVSQRSMNPREFFRQLSQSSKSSGSSQSGKPPFRRYQRSLTDTAFIFEKASASSGATSPLSPSITSPFSRTPSSPFNHCMSPTSPVFRPITSPQSPRRPMRTPPASPIEGSGPFLSSVPLLADSKALAPQSSLPDLPAARVSAAGESSSGVETETSSIDASEQKPDPVPDSPSALLPEYPVPIKESSTELLIDTRMPTDIEQELNIVVGSEKEEALENANPLEAHTNCLPPAETSSNSHDLAEPEHSVMPRSEPASVSPLIEVEEHVEEEEEEEPHKEEAKEPTVFCSSGEQPESETSGSDEPTLAEEIEADVQDELEECAEETKNCVIEEERPDQNGVCPENGTAKEYDDSSDHSTPEKCTYIVNRVETEDDAEIEKAENGESSEDRPLLRVRALYDYQAEDDTELSFEPGDIIIDVETVDKAWWRGFSKDGRQGLFPSNYVETI